MADSLRVEEGYFDWREAIDGDGNYTSAEVPYFVFNAGSESAALNAVKSKASSKIGRLYLDEIEIEERINDNTYKVIASYAESESKDRESSTGESDETTDYGNSDPSVSFDTTGGSRHINTSLKTISKVPNNATDYGGAIGVDGEGNVNGVDVSMPVMTFSETHYLKPSRVTDAYKKQLFSLTGKVNDNAFRGFSIGEVLFLGVNGRRTGTSADDLWELTFNFSVSPNQSEVKISDSISVTNKAGWDYLWVRFGDKVVNGAITKVPVAAYVERVYEAADFSNLKIDAKVVNNA